VARHGDRCWLAVGTAELSARDAAAATAAAVVPPVPRQPAVVLADVTGLEHSSVVRFTKYLIICNKSIMTL